MESKSNEKKTTETMSRRGKDYGIDLTDMTIMSTPRPQACSTVQRKEFRSPNSNAFAQYLDNRDKKDSIDFHDESSLGILDNLSSRSGLPDLDQSMGQLNSSDVNKIETRRQMARELLLKITGQQPSFSYSLETDKENNANSQNMSSNDITPPTLTSPSQFISHDFNKSNDQRTLTDTQNISISSVNFQPEEITARSSEMSPSPNDSETSSSKFNSNRFSFNSTAAELMAKFSSDDFLSGSRLNGKLDADEQSYVQNFHAIPLTTSTEKERMEFSCFSGVMGDMDLSVESCAGRKVSVGEFFKRKCGGIGQLADGKNLSTNRPSFGLRVKSPERQARNTPLVNLTTMSESTLVSEKTLSSNLDSSKDMDEDVISLSRIARAMEESHGTPRGLVDKLLMFKKLQKEQKNQKQQQSINCTGETYTVASQRSSLPSLTFDNSAKLSSKLSFDSKALNNPPALKSDTASSRASLENSQNTLATKLANIKTNNCMVNNETIAIQNNPSGSIEMKEEIQTPKSESKLMNFPKKEVESPISYPLKKEVVSSPHQSFKFINEKLIIGSNSQELYKCIVGVKRTANIKMLNESDRWLMCTCKVFQIQGDQQNVKLEVPEYAILIEPGKSQTVKVTVTLLSIGNPVMTLLSILVKDMTTREEFTKTHMMCFIPEDQKIEVLEPQSNELNFNLSKTFPIKLRNNFDSNVPIEIFILNNEQRQFNINIPNERIITTFNKDQQTVLVVMLNSDEEFLMNIQTNYRPSKIKMPLPKNPPVLVIRVNNEFQTGSIIKQILLRQIDFHQTPEIEVFETDIPLVLSNKKNSNYLRVKNITDESISLGASVLISKECEKENHNFVISPKVLRLGNGESAGFLVTLNSSDSSEKHGVIRLNSGMNFYWHPVIGESMSNDQSSDSLRCETPQQVLSVSSPSSPHSIGSSRSGRNSPRSSVSGATVAGDTIPIQATHASLSWTSVKVGKYETKEFTIRNTSNNRIKLQAIITDIDKSFKFLKDRESSTSIVLALQKMESKTFTIIFSPNSTGANAGKITFRHYEQKNDNKESRPTRIINLYGCGGYAKVNISQALKIMGDQMWLSLGKLSGSGTLHTRVKLENNGDLPAYAKITLVPKAVYPSMETSWNIEPTELILRPKEYRWISIEFRPRKEDLALLKGDVSDMGILTIAHGDEPTRWRIRRLCKKLSEAGQINKKDHEVFRNVVYPICKILPEEKPIQNLSIIRDTVNDLGVLCRGVNRHVITLMMELNSDDSISIFQDDSNESHMFQSLCSDTSTFMTNNEDSYMPSETLSDTMCDRHIYEEEFTVLPTFIALDPPDMIDATILIRSTSNTAQPFETKLSHPDLLAIVPAGGMIPAKREVLIKVQCRKNVDKRIDAVLQIFTCNEKRDVAIKITPPFRH